MKSLLITQKLISECPFFKNKIAQNIVVRQVFPARVSYTFSLVSLCLPRQAWQMLFIACYPLLDGGWAISHTPGFTSCLAEKMQTLLGE